MSSVGGPLLLVGSLVAVIGLVVAGRRKTFALTEAEREWLEFREDRGDFDEWIVTMRLPDEVEKMPRAEADTLADLVDFAIDTDNAVVEHPDTGTFAVVHDGYRYAYPPPSNPATVDDADADEEGDSSVISDYDFGETEDAGAESEEIEEDVDAAFEEIEDADAEADDGNAGDADATADPEEIEDRDERKATSE